MDAINTLSRYAERRDALQRHMGKGVAIIPTATARVRNRDSEYLYRFDSYFYYLSGFSEPEAVLVVVAGDQPQSILFCRKRDPGRELWDGIRMGPEGAKATSTNTCPSSVPTSPCCTTRWAPTRSGTRACWAG